MGAEAGESGATLIVGTTGGGTMCTLVEEGGGEISSGFLPEVAEDIAGGLRVAAERARSAGRRACSGNRRCNEERRR